MWCDDGITGCCEVQDGSPMGVQGYATDAVESHASEHGIPLGLVTRMKGGNCAGDTTVKGLTEVYFVCDMTAREPVLTKITGDFWLCILRVKMATREACGPAALRGGAPLAVRWAHRAGRHSGTIVG